MASPFILTNFATGEVSRKIAARPDYDKYPGACWKAENGFVDALGGYKGRTGMQYLESTPNNGISRLIPFDYSVIQSYALLFSDEAMRVYMDGAQVEYDLADVAEWDAQTAYSVDNVRKDSDVIYRCIEDVALSYSEDTDTGSAISSSYSGWPPSYAFDPDVSGWISGEENPGVDGVSYVGWDYGSGETRTIKSVYFKQDGANYCTSLKLQKSDNGSDWSDVETFSIVAGEQTLTPTEEFTCRACRVLANSASASTRWIVSYMIFYVLSDNTAPASDPTHWIADYGVEIASPFGEDDLKAIKTAQSFDVLYLVHSDYNPQYLERTSHKDWSINDVVFSKGPFRDENTSAMTVTVSPKTADAYVAGTTYGLGAFCTSSGVTYRSLQADNTGHTPASSAEWWEEVEKFYSGEEVKVTASSSLFDSLQAGMLFSVGHYVDEVYDRQTLTSTTTIDLGYVKGNYTFMTTGTWTGNIKIQRSLDGGTTWKTVYTLDSDDDQNASSTGTESDDGVKYQIVYTHTSGTCKPEWRVPGRTHDAYILLDTYSSATVMTGTCVNEVYSTEATDIWAEGSFSDYRGWPGSITFHENRLFFSGVPGDPQKVFGSTVNDYTNMLAGSDDDQALIYPFGAESNNPVRWLISKGKDLVFGTMGGEWALRRNADGGFNQENVAASRDDTNGSDNLKAILAKGYVLFVQRQGKKVIQLTYDFESDSYHGRDLTMIADHILGEGVEEWDYQKQPDSIIWAIRPDGQVGCLSFLPEEKIYAWSRIFTGAMQDDDTPDAEIESLCVLPEEIYFVINRTIDSETVRYVEYMRPWDGTLENGIFLDSCVVDTGGSTTISNLDHLEGKTVSAYKYSATGVRIQTGLTVASGQVTISEAGTRVVVGLPFTPKIQTVEIDIPSRVMTMQGRIKTLGSIKGRFYKTIGCKMGPDENNADSLNFGSQPYTDDDLISGDVEILWPGGWEDNLSIYVEQPLPLPFHLLGIIGDTEAEDGDS